MVGTKQVQEKTEFFCNQVWEVTDVNDLGTAQIQAKIERIRMKIESPDGNVNIDTTAKEDAGEYSPQVKTIKEIIHTIKLRFSVDNRGRVLRVETDENVNKKLESLYPGVSERFSEEGLKRTLKQILPVLPESPVTLGDTWDNTLEFNRAKGYGCQKANVTYCYVGRMRFNNVDVEKITTEAMFDWNDAAAAFGGIPFRVARQDNPGVIYFDNGMGRLIECENSENCVVQIGSREKVLWQIIDVVSKIKFKRNRGQNRGQVLQSNIPACKLVRSTTCHDSRRSGDLGSGRGVLGSGVLRGLGSDRH